MTLRSFTFFTTMRKEPGPDGPRYLIDSDLHAPTIEKARSAAGYDAVQRKAKTYVVEVRVLETIDDREA